MIADLGPDSESPFVALVREIVDAVRVLPSWAVAEINLWRSR